MIKYEQFELPNGLKVYVHVDNFTPIAAFNLCYNVGSRDEEEHRTGFAHLFEHLMFGGSVNIPAFDEPLQRAGGQNNAFTSPDITNYYMTLPVENLETAFWLESDRMLSLSFDPKVLEVQRNVVIEEFKQRYLNQPYDDVWLHLRPLAYKKHPYRWATIGKDIRPIEEATMEDVKTFFHKFYKPNNAVLVVGGRVTVDQIKQLSEKWFGAIPAGVAIPRNYPSEDSQKEKRMMEVEREVPLNAYYRAYPSPGRYHKDYFLTDLWSDILGRGRSSRLHQTLVKEQELFSSIDVYTLDSLDDGLLVISGKLNEGVGYDQAEAALDIEIDKLLQYPLSTQELEKVKNQAYASLAFSEIELLNRVMAIAFAANAGDAEEVNRDKEKISAIQPDQMQAFAKTIFMQEKQNILYYRKK